MAAADHRAEELAVVNVAGGERRDCDIGIHADDLRINILILEEVFFLSDGHGQIRHVRIGNGDPNPVERVDGRADDEH